jgi:pSer/pThr/pTyr-binding forkhead associated (FHA) protein
MNAILAFSLRLMLVLLSYVFLGWIIYTVYADIKKGTSTREEKITPPIDINAQFNDDSLSRRFRQNEIILGRDPSADFPLKNETISLRHCKLSYHHKQWWIEDLDSTNGSYLNNALITTPTVLTDGDSIRLGNVEITLKTNQNSLLE